jgi:hypothetical protein
MGVGVGGCGNGADGVLAHGAVIRGARRAGAGERGEGEWWARETACGARHWRGREEGGGAGGVRGA